MNLTCKRCGMSDMNISPRYAIALGWTWWRADDDAECIIEVLCPEHSQEHFAHAELIKKGALTMFEIRINNYDDRCAMVRALSEAGYTVRVAIRKHLVLLRSDAFVIIVASPKLPVYEKDTEGG